MASSAPASASSSTGSKGSDGDSDKSRVLVIGASGAVGKAVMGALETLDNVEVITASRSSGTHRVDATDDASVEALFKAVGTVDHVVFAAGTGHVGPLATMTPADVMKSIDGKFMSQVRVTLTAQKYLSPGGSIALTSGLLEFEPMPKFASLSAVNAALRGWVAGVALELKNGCRINCVSPGLLAASETVYGKLFPGFKGISPEQVGRAYLRCLFGGITGRTLLVVAESWRSS